MCSVYIEDSAETFSCREGQNVLLGMERLGRKGIPVGCRGGGCGVCKVRVTAGAFRTDRMSRDCVSQVEEGEGIALACRLYAESDLQIKVLGKMLKRFQLPALTGSASKIQ